MKKKRKIRYAVVGLGYISQVAVLPAFEHAKENSELVALVSGDPVKLSTLARKYGVPSTYLYEEYTECLRSGDIDAVYIALPNSMHAEYAVRAASHGVHVLCEKPLAVTVRACERMIDTAARARVKLMTAYRLHFEKTNLKAIELARSGKLGELKFFNSIFSNQVREGNSRLKKALGGGSIFDLGIYCINAARNLFQAEPLRVAAFSAQSADRRFREVDEMSSAVLYFPDNKLATFTSSFGATDASSFEIVGSKGILRLDPAYEFAEGLRLFLTIDGKKRETKISQRDQFAPELLYFSDCILHNKEPEPSGKEGLADIRVISALYESARTGKIVNLDKFQKKSVPRMTQEKSKPPVQKPDLVHAENPSL